MVDAQIIKFESKNYAGAYCRTESEHCNTSAGNGEVSLEKAFAAILGTLGERESAVLKLRFGFGGDKPLSSEEIGKRLGLEPEEVRRITGKAIRKLRHPARRSAILKRKSEYLSLSSDFYKDLFTEVFGEED